MPKVKKQKSHNIISFGSKVISVMGHFYDFSPFSILPENTKKA